MQTMETDDELFDLLLKRAAVKAFNSDDKNLPPLEYTDRYYKPSASLNKRIEKIINKQIRKEKIQSFKKAAQKAAVVLVVFVTVSGAVLFSVEASRNAILNAFVRWREDSFSVEYGGVPDTGVAVYKPTYLPEGFKEVTFTSSGRLNQIIYENEIGEDISLTQLPAISTDITADYEEKTVVEILINNNKGFLVNADEQEKSNTLFWEQDGFLFNIISTLENNELILIAESIRP